MGRIFLKSWFLLLIFDTKFWQSYWFCLFRTAFSNFWHFVKKCLEIDAHNFNREATAVHYYLKYKLIASCRARDLKQNLFRSLFHFFIIRLKYQDVDHIIIWLFVIFVKNVPKNSSTEFFGRSYIFLSARNGCLGWESRRKTWLAGKSRDKMPIIVIVADIWMGKPIFRDDPLWDRQAWEVKYLSTKKKRNRKRFP